MKPTDPERNIWHMEPEDARPDASPEPQPLIAPGSVVGLWLVEHLPVVHAHDHAFYEMALVLSGSGFHVCGDREEPVQAGTVVFVPPGVAHGYRGCRDMEVYNCFFRAELSEFELLWAARDDALGALFGRSGTQRLKDDHVVIQVDRVAFEQCVTELDAIRYEDPSERSHARQIGHLLLALDLIARHGQRYGPAPTERRLATPRVVTAVLDAFDADLARHWTLAELSTEVYVGSFHLAHEFKRSMGISPMAYLARRRAERAGVLLAGTDDSIASIGRAVGWPEPAAFSRQFSKAFGVSPREFRRRRAESRTFEDMPS
jgi:AraC family L-rhamnose operon transcriptional activator RhaR